MNGRSTASHHRTRTGTRTTHAQDTFPLRIVKKPKINFNHSGNAPFHLCISQARNSPVDQIATPSTRAPALAWRDAQRPCHTIE